MLLCSWIRIRSVFPLYRNEVRGMNTLKEILVDAARYRWLRERDVTVHMENETWIALTQDSLDDAIDEATSLDN